MFKTYNKSNALAIHDVTVAVIVIRHEADDHGPGLTQDPIGLQDTRGRIRTCDTNQLDWIIAIHGLLL